MQRGEHVSPVVEAEILKGLRGRDGLAEVSDHLVDRVADDIDPVALDTLTHEVLHAPLGVGHQDATGMVDDPSIDLLRHPVVETTIAGLEMEYRNAATCCRDRGEARIRVAEMSTRSGATRSMTSSERSMIAATWVLNRDASMPRCTSGERIERSLKKTSLSVVE